MISLHIHWFCSLCPAKFGIRFINERIESLVISARKVDKESKATDTASESRTNTPSRILADPTQLTDPSFKGVELVQLKKDQKDKEPKNHTSDDTNGTFFSKDPLLSMDTRSTRSWGSLPDTPGEEGRDLLRPISGGEWGDKLDEFSRRKTEALAPEHFDNMWTKGRDYKRKEDTNPSQQNSLVGVSNSVEQSTVTREKERNVTAMRKDLSYSGCYKNLGEDNTAMREDLSKVEDLKSVPSDEDESWSSSYTEDEDTSSVMGLDSPGVKVWDGKNKRNFSHIHHPLETVDGHKSSKDQRHSKKLHRNKSAKKRSRSSVHNGQVWQEVERTSFLLGEGQDVLNYSKMTGKPGDSSEDSEAELLGRIYSGATTSSSMSFASLPGGQSLAANSAKNSVIGDPFFKLRCEVLQSHHYVLLIQVCLIAFFMLQDVMNSFFFGRYWVLIL